MQPPGDLHRPALQLFLLSVLLYRLNRARTRAGDVALPLYRLNRVRTRRGPPKRHVGMWGCCSALSKLGYGVRTTQHDYSSERASGGQELLDGWPGVRRGPAWLQRIRTQESGKDAFVQHVDRQSGAIR